ncbi:hypothetical protein SETIT_9G289500v2 [Setaria italica]|uniref:Uncharacterized protein n=1 Tax=Setaria italica TaxID=4555 RepID=A0A368SLR8_SETIT|nr:hypothetical protein SETIT_9G289500v2 [Setaria italica]
MARDGCEWGATLAASVGGRRGCGVKGGGTWEGAGSEVGMRHRRRLVCDPRFLRRYHSLRGSRRAPPLLGFFRSFLPLPASYPRARPPTASRPSASPSARTPAAGTSSDAAAATAVAAPSSARPSPVRLVGPPHGLGTPRWPPRRPLASDLLQSLLPRDRGAVLLCAGDGGVGVGVDSCPSSIARSNTRCPADTSACVFDATSYHLDNPVFHPSRILNSLMVSSSTTILLPYRF